VPRSQIPCTRADYFIRTSPILNDLDQKIYIGMMNAVSEEVDGLDVVLTELVSFKQMSTSISQIGESSSNYACLTNNSEIEVNLVENEQKDILVAPAIDEDAQKEAAHDSGASSTLIGFRDVYHDYKKQVIPIRTAGKQFMPLV
jgi:hypothetical protein